jgi:anti-sigma factor RsiW
LTEVDDHLKSCDACREEVKLLETQSALFNALRAPATPEVSAGFYARVMNRVETQRPSPWSLFGESLFAKRLVYASATLLILIGTFVVSSSSEGAMEVAEMPEVILAGHGDMEPVRMENPQRDRDAVLVNLATYEQAY